MTRQRRGFTLIELMVSSAVTFVTVLAVSAAFLGYTQSFYTQAGIRGGQASLRQTHLMVVRNLRLAAYGMEPSRAFDFPTDWHRKSLQSVNRSDELLFRMRNPAYNAFVASVSESAITLTDKGTPEALRKGQILQVVCPGAIAWTYARLSEDVAKGATTLPLEPSRTEAGKGVFPYLNEFSKSACFNSAGSSMASAVNVFKIDVYDYKVRLIDDDGIASTPARPYLFRRHGLGEKDESNAYGEPVAEDIEAMRVTFLREDGTAFVPDPTLPAPDYNTPAGDDLRKNNSPANIRAVVIGLVARSTTRDTGVSSGSMSEIPSFGRIPPDESGAGGLEPALKEDPISKKPVPSGFRRIVSEMSVQIRNMRSSRMPVPVYTLQTGSPTACKGELPGDNFNCAGG
jgi:type IV pilus assembly protein PilW